jgi:flagellar basal body-associated protein FliL
MEEKSTGKSNWKIAILIITIIVIAIAGVCFWYFQIKKPHDTAVSEFNAAAEQVTEKNAELDNAISAAQAVLDNNEPAYSEATINDITVAISDANLEKRVVPELPDKTNDIKAATTELLKPLDYSASIANIADKKMALEDSIKQMKQITNPSGDFIIQRLQGIDGISACQAVTEDHDPNGNLNKQGGYTAAIYFSSPWINQDDVYGNDIVDKGTDCGGCVEVYASEEDAESRNVYLSTFDGAGFLNSGSHTVLGTVVIRTSSNLTATQQNALTQAISDKLLELQ